MHRSKPRPPSFVRISLAVVGLTAVATLATGCLEEGEPSADDLASGFAEDSIEVLDGIQVARPAEDESVTMEIFYEDGQTEIVTVRTDEDGQVELEFHDDFGLSFPRASCPKKCDDKRYAHLGFKWKKKLQWRYNDAGRPSRNGKSATIADFKSGFGGVQSSRNACGMSDQVSATHAYLGTTSRKPNVVYTSSAFGCGARDGANVVGWGALPPGYLGVTCTYSVGSEAVESDMRFNKAVNFYNGNKKPDGCSGRVSLRSVATHEAGHAYGLGHSYCSQTMAPSMGKCSDARRRFGKGDVMGLRALY